MAFFHSPRAVTDGLVLVLDAGNPESYPGSGTTWKDISGNSNNGTLTNGPAFDSGNGGSIVFDGSNDYINCSNNSSISFGQSKSFTIETIFKTSNYSQNVGTLIARRALDGSSETDYMIFYQGDILTFGTGFAGDSGAWFGTTSFNINNQIMVATMVVNSTGAQTGTKQVYKDGGLLTNISYAAKASSTTNNTYIGKFNGNGGYFSGNIYSTRIYNRALTAQEVLQNYNATRRRFGI